ncbi:hypothetical protein B0H34DRAFT_721836 [Crassisporium funariophilum]|nr:hypothetical protein B0H34DRAFT_721836 [Crassisporium funariophilum]
MPKCHELCKLPRVPRFTSILWRHQTPGSPQSVFTNTYLRAQRSNPTQSRSHGDPASLQTSGITVLDPSHPGLSLRPPSVPSWRGPGLGIKLVPMALLQQPDTGVSPFPRPMMIWSERVQRVKDAGITATIVRNRPTLIDRSGNHPDDVQLFFEHVMNRLSGRRAELQGSLRTLALRKLSLRVPMSYLTATSKDRMGPKRHMRRRITTRIKTALNLIVSRGAYVETITSQSAKGSHHAIEGGKAGTERQLVPRMKFSAEEAKGMGTKWIMQGWSYIFYPDLHVFNMPYETLVPLLREGLRTLYASANSLERQWLAEALVKEGSGEANTSRPTQRRFGTGGTLESRSDSMDGARKEHPVSEAQPESRGSKLPGDMKADTKGHGVRKLAPRSIKRPDNLPEHHRWERQLRFGLDLLKQRIEERS